MSIPGGSRLQFFQQLSTLSLPGIVHYRSALRVHSCSAVSLETLILLRVSMAFYLTKYWSDTWQLNTHAYKITVALRSLLKHTWHKTANLSNRKLLDSSNLWSSETMKVRRSEIRKLISRSRLWRWHKHASRVLYVGHSEAIRNSNDINQLINCKDNVGHLLSFTTIVRSSLHLFLTAKCQPFLVSCHRHIL